MRYFTIDELCRSDTAKRRGLRNEPSAAVVENLTALVDNVLDPLREAYGKPIRVTSGFRCPTLNQLVGGAANSQHCFDEQTEILTTDGWKKHDEVQVGQSMFSYSIDKDCIEIVPIENLIRYHYDGDMVKIKNKHLDILCTDQHRMLLKYVSHKYKRHGNKKISEQGQKYFDSLKTDNDKWHIELAKDVVGKRRIMMCASKMNGGETKYDVEFLRVCIAVICDGCVHLSKGSFKGITFSLKKTRKIERLGDLLSKCGIPYKVYVRKYDNATKFYINATNSRSIVDFIGTNKELPLSILSENHSLLKELVIEYARWDGCFDKRENTNVIFISTSNKHNYDVLQSMCALSGMRSVGKIHKFGTYNIRGRIGEAKDNYCISIIPEKDSSKISEPNASMVRYNGIVWCVTNKNSTLIMRRNGRISIQGNCLGQAADIVGASAVENQKLLDLVQRLGLPFDQLINEKPTRYGPSWVHVSFGPRNRRQVLTIRK